MILLKQ